MCIEMSFWNTKMAKWLSETLVDLSNYVWRKRKAAEEAMQTKKAPLTPPSLQKKH